MADNTRVAQTPEEVAAAKQYTKQDENRKLAFSKALELLRILGLDDLEREMIAQRTFTRTEVVKKTTLSHRKALDVLETLQTFGYVALLDTNKTKFRFTFNADDRAAVYKAKIIQLTTILGTAIEEYNALLLKDYPKDVYERETLEMERYLTKALELKR